MTKKDLAELLKYSSPLEIYVVTWQNTLIKLLCPFEVQVVHDIGTLKTGQFVFVEEIKVTIELKTVFIIDTKAYYFYHFDILV